MKISRACLVAIGFALLAGIPAEAAAWVIQGQIVMADAGKIQKTGRAPVWVYEAANGALTNRVPLPDFGGRSRADLTRIRDHYPAVLTFCSNYQGAIGRSAAAELKYRATNEVCRAKINALHGQTSGPDYDEVRQWQAATIRAANDRWRAVDAADDEREWLFYWFNVNPGILYAATPDPLTVVQTDANGNFTITLPAPKNLLLAVHAQGLADGQKEHYFWLAPVSASLVGTGKIILNPDNVTLAKRESELKPAQLCVLYANTSGIAVGTPRRSRDTRPVYQPW